MKLCPCCQEELLIVDVDLEGFDVIGCVVCDLKLENNDNDM